MTYLSLLALSSDRDLWSMFYNQENLLFTKDDFSDPENSRCFLRLKNSQDSAVADLAGCLERFCSTPVGQIPDLETVLGGETAQSPLMAPSTYPEAQPFPTAPTVPEEQPPRIYCNRCGRPNPPELIYCTNDGCVAVLHPERRLCGRCHEPTPVNAVYCPECGIKILSLINV